MFTECSQNHVQLFVVFFGVNLYQGTPIHRAAGKGHLDTMNYLIEKGASINIKDEYGVSEVMITVQVTLVPTTS